MGASKGSNICFRYSPKFMSDGSGIGAYLLQFDSTIGRERLRIAAAVSAWRPGEGPQIKEANKSFELDRQIKSRDFSYCISPQHVMLPDLRHTSVLPHSPL